MSITSDLLPATFTQPFPAGYTANIDLLQGGALCAMKADDNHIQGGGKYIACPSKKAKFMDKEPYGDNYMFLGKESSCTYHSNEHTVTINEKFEECKRICAETYSETCSGFNFNNSTDKEIHPSCWFVRRSISSPYLKDKN